MSKARREVTVETGPVVEPVSLNGAKEFLRIDATDLASEITPTPSIDSAAHAPGTVTGDSVDVSSGSRMVSLNVGVLPAGATLDARLQDSPDDNNWTDVPSGAFTQVTPSNDEDVFTKAYTLGQDYLRGIAVVAGDTIPFSLSVLENAPGAQEDDLVNEIITAAREACEGFTGRALITQTRKLHLSGWPAADHIKLPFPTLISVTSITYKIEAGTTSTLSASTVYDVETASNIGRVFLRPNQSWPSDSLYTGLPVVIEYVCGYGASASNVPGVLKLGILQWIANEFNHRMGNAPPFPESMINGKWVKCKVDWF